MSEEKTPIHTPLPGQPAPPPPAYTPQPTQPLPAYTPQPAQPQPVGGYQQQTTVVIQQPTGAQPGSTFPYHQQPAFIVCQNCNATVTTSISYQSGLVTYIAAGVICLFGCWLGCCLIPFCVDAAKDVIHTCPNCKAMVGKFSHL